MDTFGPIAPTIQMLLGLVVFHEVFSSARLAGFIVIWAALGLYVAEGLLFSRSARHSAR